jgi:hypothetical protein
MMLESSAKQFTPIARALPRGTKRCRMLDILFIFLTLAKILKCAAYLLVL